MRALALAIEVLAVFVTLFNFASWIAIIFLRFNIPYYGVLFHYIIIKQLFNNRGPFTY